jgi:hypothetical protein
LIKLQRIGERRERAFVFLCFVFVFRYAFGVVIEQRRKTSDTGIKADMFSDSEGLSHKGG